MFYNLLGRVTWKALKLYFHRNGARTAVVAGVVVGGLVVAGVAAKRAIGGGGEA
ncbi:MAG TPA: hypothetical protein VNZ62_10920 [Capillimicrobium sp.]|nr:hypothetical protein [Capillimicrobium sp.]